MGAPAANVPLRINCRLPLSAAENSIFIFVQNISNGRRRRAKPDVREQSERNPQKSEQSHFLQGQKMIKSKKKKQRRGKHKFSKAIACFLRGLRNFDFRKKDKRNGISNGSRTRVAGMKTRCPRPLDDGDASRIDNAPNISLQCCDFKSI